MWVKLHTTVAERKKKKFNVYIVVFLVAQW